MLMDHTHYTDFYLNILEQLSFMWDGDNDSVIVMLKQDGAYAPLVKGY